ncbi:hypothetical protein KUL17_14920 [Alteromonas sp. KUL17]|uniref:hypothetical protein n=1 Tax=Alteromonas sp. KUL17 TaxID=2480796 RepID=UPI001036F755|nr:hypothetical protein [Alteromonas sp. KUL17]TAP29222.1 hypothetical protein KUL49_07385 [Alteromonas sp. KUL17]GEA02595.1 hypothetical protein KUL17_14920 [Alteromonas sp. KUL17]
MNLKVKDTIHFYPIDEHMYHVYDASTSRHFKLGAQEVNWLKLLDGKTPLEALQGRIPLEYFERFIGHVKRLDLLEGSTQKESFSPTKIKLFRIDPTALLEKTGRFPEYYRLFLDWASFPIFILNILAITLLVPQVQNIRENLEFSWLLVAFYFVAILIVGIVHEGSHALVARSYNVKVPRVGMMLFFLHPSFYADVSGINLLTERPKRVRVLLAGVQGNNIMVLLGLLMTFLPLSELALQFVLLFVALNFVLMFLNLVPFVEYDGYYIFQELLGEPRFSRNSLVSHLTPNAKRLEYSFFFHFSHLFQFVLITSMLILIHQGILMLWDSIWIDGIFLALIIGSYPALMAHRIRSAR